MDVPVRRCGGWGPTAFVWDVAPCVWWEVRLNWLLYGEPVLCPPPSGEEPPNTLPSTAPCHSLTYCRCLGPQGKKKILLYRLAQEIYC